MLPDMCLSPYLSDCGVPLLLLRSKRYLMPMPCGCAFVALESSTIVE